MPETRFNPITGDRVLLSPDRGDRPGAWTDTSSSNEPMCPFCPGNEEETPPELEASGGKRWEQRVVPNKYPATVDLEGSPAHEVIIEAREHDLAFESMGVDRLTAAVDVWKRRVQAQSEAPGRRYVSIFRNEGRGAGQSIPHPHSQLLALDHVPVRISRELEGFSSGRCPLCVLAHEEIATGETIIDRSGSLLLFAPRASRTPFEMWVMDSDHVADWTRVESFRLAELLLSAIRRLRKVHPLAPFNLTLVTAPLQTEGSGRFHWYAEIIPRLTNLAGFEFATGSWINIEPPERAALRLREA